MTEPGGSTAGPGMPHKPKSGLSDIDDLLSERSKAWVERQLSATADDSSSKMPLDSDPGLRPNIAGYIVGRRIGRGGMGTVYECHREGSDHRLAIKIMSSGKYAAEEERRRFMVEIGALLRLHHPHLSRLRDFGQDGAVVWFVMDYIDGQVFSAWQAAQKPSWLRIADLLAQSARAVAHAHRQGIIHRDINPGNLMVQADGSAVIMDFGLARDLASDEVLTVSGATVGTPPYMSPEQTLGSKGMVDARSDVWGMGGVLYHALCGRPPFEAGSTHEIFTAINETDVVRPSVHAPGIPKALEGIALRCLQRDPRDRYADMDALAADLERFAAGTRVVVRLPGFLLRMHRRARRHPLPWSLGAALLLVGLGFLGYAAFEHVRRWATWTTVVSVELDRDKVPSGMQALDGLLRPLADGPVTDARGLGPVVVPVAEQVGGYGWWWLERPGLSGGSRIDLDLDMPVNDAIELVIDAARVRPTEWWHHPPGWAIKVQAAEQLTVSATYLEVPAALPANPGFLITRPAGSGGKLSLSVEVLDTTLTVQIAGCAPVVVNAPLALGSGDHRGVGLRWFSPKTRLQRLRIDRIATAELVSPLMGPDALVRHGLREAALGEYRLLAADHPGTALGTQALLRAYAVTALEAGGDASLRDALYQDLRRAEDADLLAQADRIRALSLWSHGESARAVGVAGDLIARRPDFNPILAFLTDRTWQIDRPCGDAAVRLLAAAPEIGSLALADLGITDLSPIRGRKAWSVNISDNEISDLSPLATCGCTSLAAGYNRISDLAAVASMTGLRSLDLSCNALSDPSPLAGLHELQSLNLAGNQITSLTGLPQGLSELTLGMLAWPADELKEWRRVRMHGNLGNPLSDLRGLPMRNLKRLTLSGTNVEDLSVLAEARQLERLVLIQTPVRDLSPLRDLPITDLNLDGCPHIDASTIALPQLRALHLGGTGIGDESVLQRLAPGLATLDVSGCAFTRWPAIVVPVLSDLRLSGCPLSDVSGLASAPALRSLTMRGCGLRRIDPVLAQLNLARLDLRDNALTTVAPLLEHPPATLLLSGNPLDDAACEALIAAGARLGRPELAWQGASIQAARHGDLSLLRRVAVPMGGSLVAPYYSPTWIGPDEAMRLAASAGGRLAALPDEAACQIIGAFMPFERPLWLGVSLVAGQVVDDQGARAPFTAPMPAFAYRGYTSLPYDAGRLAILGPRNWTVCLDGKGSGLVIAWDRGW